MTDMIMDFTLKAAKLFNDEAATAFYEKLKQSKFQTTFCSRCQKLSFPPRVFCPDCYEKLEEWRDLPQTGTLYAFAQHDRGIRFNKPDIVGIVELDGVPWRVIGKINMSVEEARIGQKLKLHIQDFGGLSLLTFDPI